MDAKSTSHAIEKKKYSGSSSFSILPISAVQKIKRIYVWVHLWVLEGAMNADYFVVDFTC